MNCCHQDIPQSCHGGDNCPVRTAALVARIKASHPAPTVEESDNTEGAISLVFMTVCIASICIGLLIFGGK